MWFGDNTRTAAAGLPPSISSYIRLNVRIKANYLDASDAFGMEID